MKQYILCLMLLFIVSLGTANTFAAAPHWVKLGSYNNSTYKINTVIDSKADYPSNISYELLEKLQSPTTNVKTISRSVVMNCMTGQYQVLGASFWDKKDNYLRQDSAKVLLQKEITILPKSIENKIYKSICNQ